MYYRQVPTEATYVGGSSEIQNSLGQRTMRGAPNRCCQQVLYLVLQPDKILLSTASNLIENFGANSAPHHLSKALISRIASAYPAVGYEPKTFTLISFARNEYNQP